jgi:hypothetical protein
MDDGSEQGRKWKIATIQGVSGCKRVRLVPRVKLTQAFACVFEGKGTARREPGSSLRKEGNCLK